ncbi:MAG: RDD family protein [Melioribacteraceae bacterium]|nr:RDD family protein [Melioribacteraceae bacterium]
MLYALNNSNDLNLYKFTKVSLKDRFLARLYDFIKMVGIYMLSTLLFLLIFKLFYLPLPHTFSNFFAMIIAQGWFLLRDGIVGGANWGKEIRNILVICTDTFQDCTIFRSFIRNIILDIIAIIISLLFSNIFNILIVYVIVSVILFLVDILRIVLSPDGKRIGDLIAKTQVIYVDEWVKYKKSFVQE